MTRAESLTLWANRWRQLKAWRRNLDDVKIEISERSFPNRVGTCWDHEQRIVIYKGAGFCDELATLLHELAHAAVIGAAHDERWQEVFSAAVTEVTGIDVVPCAYNYRMLDRAAHEAVRAWGDIQRALRA